MLALTLQIDRELADGRQLIAGTQAAGGDRRAQPALELGVDRRGVARVDGDDVHLNYCTSSLIQRQAHRAKVAVRGFSHVIQDVETMQRADRRRGLCAFLSQNVFGG